MQPQDNQSPIDNSQSAQPVVPHEPVLGGEVVDTPSVPSAPADDPTTQTNLGGDVPVVSQTDTPVDIYASIPEANAPAEVEASSAPDNVDAPAAADYSSPAASVQDAAVPVATPAYPTEAPAVTPAYPPEPQADSVASALEVPSFSSEPTAAAAEPVQSSEVAPDVPEGPLPPLSTGGPVVG